MINNRNYVPNRCIKNKGSAEHSNYIDVGNQVIIRLWQECFALAFLLIYDVGALPTVFL